MQGMTPPPFNSAGWTRRELLTGAVHGAGTLGLAALSGLLARDSRASTGTLSGVLHRPAKAKRVIYLFMNGAPTHVDIFDYKPKLAQMHGQPVPESFIAGKRFSTMSGGVKGKLMLAPIQPFHRRGKSGAWVSDLMPFTASMADDLCIIRSLNTDAVNHAPAISLMLSGAQIPGRPTLGAWLSYGLGSERDELPTFVAMTSVSKGTSCGQIFYDFYWGSGFLPSKHQGVKFRNSSDPVLYLSDPPGMRREWRRGQLDALAELNRQKLGAVGDPEIATRISQYEMAYRMQASVPELANLASEPKSILDMYGPKVLEPGSFARNCLMARRLLERGTRYVQVMHAGWDQHNSITTELYNQCRDTDQPSWALVQDLKQRGLLDDTLVIWGGEFGRTPFIQNDIANRKTWGRDHHPYAYTTWLAGGGVKPGLQYGESDELGMNVANNGVHVHDLQATILAACGIDHEKLTYRFQGRDFRLTDVHGKVVKDLFA
jgi:hypothetical protein